MKIDLLLKELDTLNLPPDQYAITSSGVLAIHEIREANDLDVIVSKELWEDLAEKHSVINNGFESIQVGNIQFLGDGSFYTREFIARVDDQISSADIIDGHRYVTVDLIKKFKESSGRDKDKRDMALIDEYLRNHP